MSSLARFPPGPRGVVEVASAFRRLVREPETELRAAQARWGDVIGFRLGRDLLVMVADPALVGEVLVDKDAAWIKDRVTRDLSAFLGQGLLTNEGAPWRRQRKLIAPPLTRRHIAAYADTMVRRAAVYASALRHGESRDVHADMSAVTLEIVTETLFGTSLGSEPARVGHAIDRVMGDFQELVQTWRRFFPSSVPFAARRRTVAAAREIDAVVFDVIQRRRRTGELGDDLLSRLLEARDDEGSGMTDAQLRDEAVTLFVAGHETTANALSFALMLLGDHPELDARMHDEVARVVGERAATADDVAALRFTDAVAREAMRLYPPAYLIGREATRDVTVGAWAIPARTAVLMSPWAMQRDPRFFADPLAFRPDRWLDGSAERAPKYAYMPFGGGPRVCIGNHFAQMELVLVLATLAQRVRFERTSAAPVRQQAAITLRPAAGLPMRAVTRERAAG